jgi:hypothetical protein
MDSDQGVMLLLRLWEKQRLFLMNEGCLEMQGYLVGRPAPIADYAELTNEAAAARERVPVSLITAPALPSRLSSHIEQAPALKAPASIAQEEALSMILTTGACFTPIINAPEVAILGAGRSATEAVVRAGAHVLSRLAGKDCLAVAILSLRESDGFRGIRSCYRVTPIATWRAFMSRRFPFHAVSALSGANRISKNDPNLERGSGGASIFNRCAEPSERPFAEVASFAAASPMPAYGPPESILPSLRV